MIDELLAIIAPHHCYLCGETGPILCQSCKYDIASDAQTGCIVCGSATENGICSSCRTSYEKAWCVGERIDELERLLDDYKFERVRAAHVVLADLLHLVLPVLPSNTIIVPVPTIAPHIRQRGYDHTVLIAKRLAKLRDLPCRHLLKHNGVSTQRGANRKTRIAQAKQAYRVYSDIDRSINYLLVDDIVTTGATLQYAAKTLKDAGATDVWVAAIARQPLDKAHSHLLK